MPFENPILFYSSAVLLVLFALISIKLRNVIYSLFSAIVVFLLAGFVFFILGSEYNAIIQVAIYGIAVPVLIGLTVMFTDFKAKVKDDKKISKLNFVLYFICAIFIMSLFYLVMTSLAVRPEGFNITDLADVNPHSVIQAFANGIFVNYVLAFELVSIILTIIVAGLVMFKKEVGK